MLPLSQPRPEGKQDGSDPPVDHDHFSEVSESSVSNTCRGDILSIAQGLTHMSCRIKLSDGAMLRMRRSLSQVTSEDLCVGQTATVTIDSQAVVLVAPGHQLIKARWNRWNGRIVFIESRRSTPIITVKVRGEPWTVKSTLPIMGFQRKPQVWDDVVIVVDPEKVSLAVHSTKERSFVMAGNSVVSGDGLVWLKGTIEAMHRNRIGCVLSMNIGDARVSALVPDDEPSHCDWLIGSLIEVRVGQWESWLKPRNSKQAPIRCSLMF